MLTAINPKLPMRNKKLTKEFYLNKLDFKDIGSADFEGYLIVKKDDVEIHFFEFKNLEPSENYGQVYIRTNDIDNLYKEFSDKNVSTQPAGGPENRAWGQREFSVLDPDNNLLTFGQAI